MAEALALAIDVGDVELVLDDERARIIAAQLAIPVVGTLGVLVRAKRLSLVHEILPSIEGLHDAGFRIGTALRSEALCLAGEE